MALRVPLLSGRKAWEYHKHFSTSRREEFTQYLGVVEKVEWQVLVMASGKERLLRA
jgi:hypothetical protein